MVTCISHSPDETAALGEQWGRVAESGLVIGLCGDLGAGKTQLVKGLARGLGIAARVHSPTFALVNIYDGGRLTLFHLDLYRLDTREQILAAGLEEYLKPEGVTVIEWAERWFGEVQSPEPRAVSHQSSVISPQSPVTKHRLPITDNRSRITDYQSPPHFRLVQIEVLSETERRIVYEDTSA
jgi:tRNA threonylcarbamoyladenosine biosynthesis protein TsaE